MKKLCVEISEEAHAALKKVADHRETTISCMIRGMIRREIEARVYQQMTGKAKLYVLHGGKSPEGNVESWWSKAE